MRMIWILSVLLCGTAQAADSVLVTAVEGQVRLEGEGVGKMPLEAFMRLNVGDRLLLPAGTRAALVYLAGGRLENWRGNGTLLVGKAESKVTAGKPELQLRQLPPEVAQQMSKMPAPNPERRHGMVRLAALDDQDMARATKSMPSSTRIAEMDASRTPPSMAERPAAVPPPVVAAAPMPARERASISRPVAPPESPMEKLDKKYRQLRADTPANDLTPEIFLLAGLFDLKAYSRIETELQRISDAFPNDAVGTALRDTYQRAIALAKETAGK
ncbi:MAG: hypothetical protein ACM3SV_04860 [Betaproteobacteria bacterium]